MATDVDHGVDGAGSAEHLAARPVARPPRGRRDRLGRVHPVDPRVEEGAAVADGHLQPEAAVAAAGLEEQDPAAPVLAQTAGDHAARRAGADDGMKLVAEEDNLALGALDFFHGSFETFFKFSTKLGTGYQHPQIHCQDLFML